MYRSKTKTDSGIPITNTFMNDIPLETLKQHMTPHEHGELNDAFEAVSEGVRLNGVIDPFAKARMDAIFAIAEIRYLILNEDLESSSGDSGTLGES